MHKPSTTTSSRLFDRTGAPIALSTKVGTGGEGTVFLLSNSADSVAKVYHAQLSSDRQEKLRYMTQLDVAELLAIAAWPTATLHNAAKDVVGFLMPKVLGYNEIFQLYNPAYRKKTFPDADWSFLIHVAMNCAAAFETVHRKGHCIGDVNQRNIMVNKAGLVKLIDCDSFQIRYSGKIFETSVGVAEYTPPELHGVNLRNVQRTEDHDLFGLAVLIFILLFMGRHPYAGRYLGSGDMSLEQAIKEFRFAYASNAPALHKMEQPPNSLPLTILPPELIALFEKAFQRGSELTGRRPRAKDWHSALQRFAKSLRTCQKTRNHKYAPHLSNCCWCDQETKGVFSFVPVTSNGQFVAFSLNQSLLSELDSLLSTVTFDAALNLPTLPHYFLPTIPAPSPTFQVPTKLRNDISFGQSVQLSTLAVIFLSCCGAFGQFTPIVCCGFLLWGLIATSHVSKAESIIAAGQSVDKQIAEKHKERVSSIQARHMQSINKWTAELTKLENEGLQRQRQLEAKFAQHKVNLSNKRVECTSLKTQFDRAIKKLEADKESKQRAKYLDGFLIEDHEFSTIGPQKGKRWNQLKAALLSFGIATANDIEHDKIMRIPGFGPAYTNALVTWRQQLLLKFRFDPTKAISQSELQAVHFQYQQKAVQLEHFIRSETKQMLEAKAEWESYKKTQGEIATKVISKLKAEMDLLRRECTT